MFSDSDLSSLNWVVLIFGIIHFLSALAAFIISIPGVTSHFIVDITNVYRANQDDVNDGLEAPVLGSVGPLNLGVYVSMAGLLEGALLLLNFAYWRTSAGADSAIAMLGQNRNPMRWFRYFLSHGVVFTTVAIVSGVTEIWNIVLLWGAAILAMNAFAAANETYNAVHVKGFFADFYVFHFAVFAVVSVMLFIYYGNTIALALTITALPWFVYVLWPAAFLLYVFLLALNYLHIGANYIGRYWYEVSMLILNAVIITATIWVTVAGILSTAA